jgi:hypothetical protein
MRACAIFDCLQALVDEVERHSGPHRPLPYPLTVRRGTPDTLFPGINPTHGQFYMIYKQEPCPALPAGKVALWVGAVPGGGCGAECTHRCEGELRIDIWQDATFPFSVEEVNAALARICGLRHHEMLQVEAEEWQAMLEYQAELEEQEVRPRGPGAPVLRCNERLLSAMRQLENPREYWHLLPEWLTWHLEETGEPLGDETRSFERAAARCLRIVERERGPLAVT